ncbi:MAG: O-antigen ligase family protein [Desulfomonile tiedjei]|nr:O-antigen ligase family protein [Desulfomonile tiedjei]
MSLAEKAAWSFFFLTCVAVAFVQPYLFTVFGHEADVYGGLLCAVSLITALAAARSKGVALKPSHLTVSFILLLLAIISGAFSSTPLSSSARSFFLMSSGLGGFWCSQILLRNEVGKRVFMWLCVGILVGFLAISLLTYFVWGKTIHYLIDPNPRTLINRILLLSLGPIAMIGTRKPVTVILGILLVCLSYVALLLDAIGFNRFIHTMSIILLVAWLLVAVFGRWTKLQLALVLCSGVVVFITAVYVFSPIQSKLHTIMNDNRTKYRLENYEYSWHIVKQHPVIGIGLETPLSQFLWNYDSKLTRWPNRQFFYDMVKQINSPDNMYLAFMVYLGLPFLLLYLCALLGMLWKLLRIAWRPPPGFGFHPLAILIPVVASTMHFVDLDALLYGDINWYFHVLLGLVPAYGGSSK